MGNFQVGGGPHGNQFWWGNWVCTAARGVGGDK